MDSVQRPSSSCSQRTISIPVNAPKIGDELRPDFDSGHITSNNSSRVQKPETIKETHSYSSPTSEWPPLLSNVILAQQNLIRHSQEVKDILNDYQFQKETIQVQQFELEHLKASSIEKSKEIQTLEAERASLKAKIKKMELLSIKYKNHMNEVVIAQKNLMRESSKIQKVQIDAKLFQTSYDSRDEHIKKLESLLHEAREFRAPAQKLLASMQGHLHFQNLANRCSTR
jgi:chromosome segregation ATPase